MDPEMALSLNGPRGRGTGGPGERVETTSRAERRGAPVSDRPGRLFSSVRALVRRALPRRTLPFWSVTLLAVSLAAGASPAFVRTAAAVTPPPGRAPSAAPEVK